MVHKSKTWIFLSILTFLFLAAGMKWGGRQGLLLAFAIALIMNFISFFYGKRIILWTYRAKPLEGADHYGINKLLTSLAKKADISKPKAFLIPSSTPNSFSIGLTQYSSVIAITEGFTKILTLEEQEAILAHEISHIKNHDMTIMMTAALMGSLVMYFSALAQWIVLFGRTTNHDKPTHIVGKFFVAIFAPIAAALVQLAINRKMEILADQGAVELTSNHHALASAIWKMHHYSLSKPMPVTLSTAHLFSVSPIENKGIAKLFSTHATSEERIKNLTGRSPHV
jgi:heat shock protein HtpX